MTADESGISYPYGASYSPLMYPEAEWEDDLRLMAEAGMNLVRIGDVHGSWDRLEPRPGAYDFERLTAFYRAAEEFGISALLSTGASCPPLWLAEEHPEVILLSSRGERYPLGSSYHWACIHHPAFLESSDAYAAALAETVRDFPNHFGWQITNEIGFPFNPTREQGALDLYCYCNFSRKAFRDWVRDKYRTLEEVTRAWAWGTTNFVYTSWDQISPPESLPSAWSGVTRWIDWRLFWQHEFTGFAARQHRLLQEHDPDHPTSINTFNFKGYDRFGTFTGLDQWGLAEEVDHIGYDLYPGSGAKLKSRPEHNSIFLDHGRSVSEVTGKAYWLHEVESGPIGGWLLGPDHNTRASDLENYCLEGLGHDVKLMLYMPWKEWAYQPLHWGALVELDGSPTERLEAAGRLGRFLQDRADFLASAHFPPARVAVLESKPNAIFIRGVHDEELLFKAQRGAYRAFWDRGYNVDFLPASRLKVQDLSQYAYLVLPLLGLLDREQAEEIKTFAENGGIVVAFSRSAALDGKGWYHERLPISEWGELFGLERIQPDTLEDPGIVLNGEAYRGFLNRDLLSPDRSTEVLARFADALPAVTASRCGKGLGVYFATQADLGQIERPEDNPLKPVLELLDRRRGIRPLYRLEPDRIERTELDLHLLEDGRTTWLIFANYLDQPEQVTLKLPLEQEPRKIEQIFPQGGIQSFDYQNSQLILSLSFGCKEATILEIQY